MDWVRCVGLIYFLWMGKKENQTFWDYQKPLLPNRLVEKNPKIKKKNSS